MLCPAYNEAVVIEDKILSFLALDYPIELIKMIVISDDSTDGTNEIVSRFLDRNVELIIQHPRAGKQCAHNLVQPTIQSEYVLSTDANSIFATDAVKQLLRVMLANPEAGVVSGELRLIKGGTQDSGEGLYWKYESFLKKQDSLFASIIGSNGSIYLIRKELFEQISPLTLDDFERTLNALCKGYKAFYVPEAMVTEEVTERAQEEIKRKIRIITPEWFAMLKYRQLLNPISYFRISFIFFSHKVIRWLFFVFMIGMLLTSALIQHPFYQAIFLAQVLFYLLGIGELFMQKSGKHIPGAGIVAYFTAMCYASLVAFINFITKTNNTRVWDPIRKQG